MDSLRPGLRGTLPEWKRGMFVPTLDWGNEFWESLVWIARVVGDRGGVHVCSSLF